MIERGSVRNIGLGFLGLFVCGMLFWVTRCSTTGSAVAPTPTPIPTVIPFEQIAGKWELYKEEIISKNVDGWYGWVDKVRAKSGSAEISVDLDAPEYFFSDAEVRFEVSKAVADGLAVDDGVRFSGIVVRVEKGTLRGVSLWLDNAQIVRAPVPTATASSTSVPTATKVPTRTAQPTDTAQPTATALPTETETPTATLPPAPTQTALAITAAAAASAAAERDNNSAYTERVAGLLAMIQNLYEHQSTLPANPDQILDEVWTARLDRLQLALADYRAEFERAGAPAKFSRAHAQFINAADAYVRAAVQLVKFSADRVFERLERSNQAEIAGNAAMGAANVELDRLLALTPSAVIATPAATAATAAAANTATATPAPAATEVPVATGAAQEYIIVEVPRIVGASIDAVDRMLGEPDDAFDWYAGDITQLPLGGSERDYTVRGYTVWVLFDPQGIAKGIIVQIGLAADGYRLDKWPVILSRFGLGYTKAPDFKSSMALRWNNSNGYLIYMSGVPVDNLEIMKVP